MLISECLHGNGVHVVWGLSEAEVGENSEEYSDGEGQRWLGTS